jgi:hypothetical protein
MGHREIGLIICGCIILVSTIIILIRYKKKWWERQYESNEDYYIGSNVSFG